MPITCQAYGGPCDGGIWQTMSVHTELYVHLYNVHDDGNAVSWSYDVRHVPFDGATHYWFAYIDRNSGLYIYVSNPKTVLNLINEIHPS